MFDILCFQLKYVSYGIIHIGNEIKPLLKVFHFDVDHYGKKQKQINYKKTRFSFSSLHEKTV